MQVIQQYTKITDIFIILCTSTLIAFLVSGIQWAGVVGFELLLLAVLRFILVFFEIPIVFAEVIQLVQQKGTQNGSNKAQ